MMMIPAADLLEFDPDPALILEAAGRIAVANLAATRLLETSLEGRNLHDFAGEHRERLREFIRRASGTTSQTIGAVQLTTSTGVEKRFRAFGARLPDRGEGIRLAMRLATASDRRFSVLERKVRELNHEVHLRMRAQAGLEESLRENEILLRELHHRVKNNIQTMMGLFSAAKRDAHSEELKLFVDAAIGRLLAIGTAQQLLYEADRLTSVPAQTFIEKLCRALTATFGPEVDLHCEASEGNLPSEASFPLALILNELVTNAVKHGGPGRVTVSLHRGAGDWTLSVWDEGSGIPVGVQERRASGLGLVRGLCRQLGGSLSVQNQGGALVRVKFGDGLLH